jgi:serine/threonine-protein kinase RsbW
MCPVEDAQRLPLQTLRIPSDLYQAKEPERIILQEVQKHKFSEEALFAIKLTLEEAVTNAIKHGNKCDRSKQVTIRYFVDDDQAVVFIRDEGGGFEPEQVPDPTSAERLSLPNGRGILLMKAYMTELEYLHEGTEVYLRKVKDE